MILLSQLCPIIWPLDVLCKCKLPNHFLFTFILSANTQRIIYIIMSYRAQEHYREKTVADVVFIYLNGKQVIVGFLLKKGVPHPTPPPPTTPPPLYRSFHAFREFNAAFLDDIHIFFYLTIRKGNSFI